MALQFTGSQLIEFNELGSTNALAMQLIVDTPPEGTVIWARSQPDGKGQAGTQWLSSPGMNLTFSLIYYPHFLSLNRLFSLSKISALALRQVVNNLLPQAEVKIKWPNDILVDRKKIAGILIENQLEGKHIKACILGIGLNVNQVVFAKEIEKKATSLKVFTGQDIELKNLLWMVLEALEKWYLALRDGRYDQIDRAYHDFLYGYQEEVLLEVGGKIGKWQILGLDEQGRLGITQGKRIQYVGMKEVTFIMS